MRRLEETLAHRYWECPALGELDLPAVRASAHHADTARRALAAGQDTAL